MFENESDFDHFLYKAKKDGATNEEIKIYLVNTYRNYNAEIPSFVNQFINSKDKQLEEMRKIWQNLYDDLTKEHLFKLLLECIEQKHELEKKYINALKEKGGFK